MYSHVQYASFLVRLWRLPGQNGNGISTRWQSEVEHIQSGKSWRFNTLEELSTFLQQSSLEGEGLAWVVLQVPELPDMEVPGKIII